MQIVIDIDENMYQKIKGIEMLINRAYKSLELAVLDGTVLPEHHGDLIDREELLADTVYAPSYAVRNCIYNAKAIIPATETKEPARTMLDCYKCNNNKVDVNCYECHYEPATKEGK